MRPHIVMAGEEKTWQGNYWRDSEYFPKKTLSISAAEPFGVCDRYLIQQIRCRVIP